MRVRQGRKQKGSQHWIQECVNSHSRTINNALHKDGVVERGDSIIWLSPLVDDEFAEYRDDSALRLLGVELKKRALKDFWPKRGPQWDGLARTTRGRVLMIEAKSHLQELISPPSNASPDSLEWIRRSLREAKEFAKSKSDLDWSRMCYQYTNRLAHLYLLAVVNKIDARLVHLCFINDHEMGGPKSADEWRGAIELLNRLLEVRSRRLSRFVHHVFIDVGKLRH